ncbi:Hypothetical_protein [Hexamita inflata]|uniref:Hypothetical_protein n=1 Tax=Hexamita inflata TaxID=28002 RepID=A0AA86R610_9EUKA|nr:Hypothetical protein HINF_LOCUS57687 [Hexamita inflata]
MNLTMCTIYGYGLSVYALCPQNQSQIEFKLNKNQLIQNQVQYFDQQKHITFINPKSYKYSGYYLFHSNEGDLVSIFSAKTFLFQIIQRNVQDFCVAFDRLFVIRDNFLYEKRIDMQSYNSGLTNLNITIQLWEVELLFLVYYVSNYILKYFATSNADDKFQQTISSWRLFMNYSLTQDGQKYDFDRIRSQSTIQSQYLIFQKVKIEIATCNKRRARTKINAVEDVQGRPTNSLNKLRQI